MTEHVHDITPTHMPVSVARDLVAHCETGEFTGVFACAVRRDGSMWYDSCGAEKAYVLWALEKARTALMVDTDP